MPDEEPVAEKENEHFDPLYESVNNVFSILADTEICPVSGLTGRERKQLWAAWNQMVGATVDSRDMLGIHLVLWMLRTIPGIQFPFTSDLDESGHPEDPRFLAHARAIILELDLLIKLLVVPEEFKQAVKKLCHTHVSANVQAKQFEVFRDKFGSFLEEVCKHKDGLSENHDLIAKKSNVVLWEKIMTLIAKVHLKQEHNVANNKGSFGSGMSLEGENTNVKANADVCCCVLQ